MKASKDLIQRSTLPADAGLRPFGFPRRGYRRRAGLHLLLVFLSAMVFGCAVGPDYRRPDAPLPDAWTQDLEHAAEAANIEWWKQFDDPVLDELIATALVENKDVNIAAARIAEFAGRLKTTRSALFPEIDYGAGVSRNQRSEEGAVPIRRDEERINTNYDLGVGIGWELDLWKRIGKASEASRAELMSVVEERDALALSLVSEVAVRYINLLCLDRELEITRQTVDYRGEWLQIFERRSAGGQVSGLEIAQVRSAYEQAAARVPRLELRISLAENELSVLVGRNPGPIQRGKALDALGMLEVPQGIPADVLIRRPDVRQKEQSLIAANARIGEVRARYFPKFSLTGLFGFASTQISNWLTNSASLWDAGLGVVGPLFAGGRIKGEVRQAEARQQQMLYDYLKTIQSALREVEDSLISIQKLRELMTVQRRQVAALEEYGAVARDRYDAGYASSYLEILDADRNLYLAKIEETEARKELFAALVNSYKAMGGGWESAAATVEP